MIAETSFGQWLKQRRKSLGLTRQALAQQIGCAVVTLNKIEAGERRPSNQIAELLAEHLNIPSEDRPEFIRFARSQTIEASEPWGTPFHPPTNLPNRSEPLIGRDDDIASIRSRLLRPEVRLLTLTGAPGIGKTRLALQVAAELRDDFTDGVFFIPLAPVTDAGLVPATIATMLDVSGAGPQTPLEKLKHWLRDKQMLLVLDNFEQILDAATAIAELLLACTWLKLLVTSRAPLRIRQERQYPVPPLAIPESDVVEPDLVRGYSAVELFLERAQAVKPDFELSAENAPTITSICSRLDGLPLAIELISARIKLLPPAMLLNQLHGRVLLQSDGLRDIEPRQRTLNAAIDWSYQLLNADEQTLFRRLGVFVGGWTLEAVEGVCVERLSLPVLDGMASLLDKNLIKQETNTNGMLRFTMLETIREYALARLVSEGELDALQARHAEYYLNIAETSYAGYTGVERQQRWDLQDAELANFRAALMWCRTTDNGRIQLRLVVGLQDFWSRRGYLNEAVGWMTEVLSRSSGLSDPDYRKARAQVLDAIAVNKHWRGELDDVEPLHIECIAIYRELGDHVATGEALSTYGMFFVQRGDAERATEILTEALALLREYGDVGSIAMVLFFLGYAANIQGNSQEVIALWEESLIKMRVADDRWMIGNVLSDLGEELLRQGQYERARMYLTESLQIHDALGEKMQILYTLENFAHLAAIEGKGAVNSTRMLQGAHLFGAAEALREKFAVPVMPARQEFQQEGIAILREQLDVDSLEDAWKQGRRMTFKQAMEYALSL